jgi:hypothetical protein
MQRAKGGTMNIVYVPVDERPCNTEVVQRIAASSGMVNFSMPDKGLLGYKKKAADTGALWNWLKGAVVGADALILSIDMLIYGGLLPSRLHELTEDDFNQFMTKMRTLRTEHPELPIYAFNMIMRTPKYSSSDEEPDYYEHWGSELFQRAYLQDKGRREKLDDEEKSRLLELEARLPQAYIDDYETRRNYNRIVNAGMLELTAEGVITFLSIPQDDSAEFGYTAMDQQHVVALRDTLKLARKVHMYPGADEAGATLLARAFNEWTHTQPKIYPIWSSTLGPQLIPMYEDRPFAESLKAHVLAAGCRLVESAEQADLILAYNVPGRVMQESWEQDRKDLTYTSFRNLLVFVDQMKEAVLLGKKVVVADSAYANGGDRELVKVLDEEGVLDSLVSYKAWNTNCNTLGTSISQGVLGSSAHCSRELLGNNLIYHLLDDYLYQAEIRMHMTESVLPELGLTYFDLKDQAAAVNEKRDRILLDSFQALTVNSFRDVTIRSIKSSAPWNRMFECGLTLDIQWKGSDPHVEGE